MLSEAGDILIPLEDGTITKDDFTGDIGEVLMGKIGGRENDEEIIVFKTVGIGAQDLVTARKNLMNVRWKKKSEQNGHKK